VLGSKILPQEGKQCAHQYQSEIYGILLRFLFFNNTKTEIAYTKNLYEVIKMKLKGWPFEPLEEIRPCDGGGPGGGPGVPD
jgi:hypothetical protein